MISKHNYIFSIAILLSIGNSALSQDHSSDLKIQNFLNELWEKTLSMIEKENDRKFKERQELIKKLTDENGKLSPESLSRLSEYDRKRETEEINQADEQMKKFYGNIFDFGQKIKNEQSQAIIIQEKKNDNLINEAQEAIKQKNYLKAKIIISKIEWIPTTNKKIDEEKTVKYNQIKQILNSAIPQ